MSSRWVATFLCPSFQGILSLIANAQPDNTMIRQILAVIREKPQDFDGYCQTNSNQSQYVSIFRNLCRAKLAPLGESSGSVSLEIVSAVERRLLVEMVADGGMNGGEFL